MNAGMTHRAYKPGVLGYHPALTSLFGRHAIEMLVGADVWHLRFTPPFAPGEDWLCLGVRIGAEEARCTLPRGLLRMMLRLAEPNPRAPLNSDVAILLVEMLLDDALMALEARLGCQVSIDEFDHRPLGGGGAARVSDDAADGVLVGFRVSFGAEESFDGLLQLSDKTLALIGPHLPPLTRSLGLPPVGVSVRVGGMTLTLAELRRLTAGYGLVLGPTAGRSIVLVAGDALAALAKYDGARAVVQGGWQPFEQFPLSNWVGFMTDSTSTVPEHPAQDGTEFFDTGMSDATLDDLRIPLSFEIGRRVFSLAELRTIGEGHVIEIGALLDHQVNVLAHGRRIGEGELVEVGTSLAVRLTRIDV